MKMCAAKWSRAARVDKAARVDCKQRAPKESRAALYGSQVQAAKVDEASRVQFERERQRLAGLLRVVHRYEQQSLAKAAWVEEERSKRQREKGKQCRSGQLTAVSGKG
ncbi:hypothetical protein NDU88_008598 [Pleurodeles waltl]|uniref:Flagellar FliJ protein n=1 Tax=Pleurodeles waltl TaxID=8319 RepID=A0AAV7RV77_PLEWA|nr:hypothetical protein NDU88_008598 [Pleurodeles waltl]